MTGLDNPRPRFVTPLPTLRCCSTHPSQLCSIEHHHNLGPRVFYVFEGVVLSPLVLMGMNGEIILIRS